MKRILPWIVIFLLTMVQQTHAQTEDVRILRWNVSIAVQPDATLDIREEQQIAFAAGDYTFGSRTLSIRQFEAIRNVAVFEGDTAYTENDSGEPGTFSWSVEGPLVVINWHFPPTEDDTRTFAILYNIVGAVEFDEGVANRLLWDAIPPDHRRPIADSLVTVVLPPEASVDTTLEPATYGASSDVEVTNSIVSFDIGSIEVGQGARVEVYFRLPDEFALPDEIELPGGDPNNVIGPRALIILEVGIFLTVVLAVVLYRRSRRRQNDTPPSQDEGV